jgi:hypothetical protein
MATFKAQVEGMTQLSVGTTPTDAELTQFLRDGVTEVTNRIVALMPNELDQFLIESSELHDNGFNPGSTKIISVLRETGTNNDWRDCRKIPVDLQSLVQDSESLHYASKFNPAYMVTQNNNIHVFPLPENPSTGGAANNKFKVLYVNNVPKDLTNGDDLTQAHADIKYFPNDKIYLVVLYASLRTIHANLSNISIGALEDFMASPTPPALDSYAEYSGTLANLNITIVPPVIPELDTLAPFSLSAAAPSDIDIPIISSPDITTIPKPDISGNQPSYNSNAVIGFGAGTHFANLATKSITSLAITAVPPEPPSTVVSAFGDVPTYTPPTIGGVTEDLTGNLTTGNAKADVSDWWEVAGDFIQDQEDTELGSAQIEKISTYITAYTAQAANNLNKFNELNAKYQADIGKKTKESDLLMTKYQQELGEYQQEVNKEVQEWQANTNKELQIWQSQQEQIVAEHAAKMTDAMNLFNRENTIFQANIQAELAKFQGDAAEAQKQGDFDLQSQIQEYTLTLQKFGADVQSYQSKVQAETGEYAQKLQEVNTSNASMIQKFGTELQKYTAEVQTETAEHTANMQKSLQTWSGEQANSIQKYQSELSLYTSDVQAKVTKYDQSLKDSTTKYQWLQDQYVRLKQEYDQAFIGMTPASPETPVQRRDQRRRERNYGR